jgi:pimeloyl-ACP methyl ester carboxylesterase
VDFKVAWSQAEFDRLRDQIKAFRFPVIQFDDDWAYGCSPVYLREFLDYWANEFDFEAAVDELNRFPQIEVDIDGIAIHAVHVVGEAGGRNPLLLVHGWPGSVYEFWEVIEKLAFPSRFGGNASDAFDVIVPSLPGFGFSGKPDKPVGARTAAHLFASLMTQLGYGRYRVQGGDWGAGVGAWLALDHSQAIEGLHLNYVLVHPDTQPQTEEERDWRSKADDAQRRLGAYAQLQGTKPASLAYSMDGSPVAQAAWLLERFYDWSDRRAKPFSGVFSKERLLTNILIYLMNDAFTSATYFYLGGNLEKIRTIPAGKRVGVPTAVTAYPDPRVPVPPRSWVERGYNVQRWRDAPRGGHFAAMEEPDYFVEDLRKWARVT